MKKYKPDGFEGSDFENTRVTMIVQQIKKGFKL